MRRHETPSSRSGFTLIELLVVVSILAILVGLTMAGIARVRTGQLAATTEGTVKKLQVALNQQLTATMDQAKDAKNPYIKLVQQNFADGDADRAKSLLAYAGVKRNFPQTFAEARAGLPIPGATTVPPHQAFATIPGPAGYSWDQQAAALLYIIVHDTAGRGTSVDSDGSMTGSETVLPGGLKAYKDAYGTPIAFIRWYGPYAGPFFGPDGITQAPPYVNVKVSGSGTLDPYDPQGRLAGWGNGGNRTAALGFLNSNYVPAFSPVLFDGKNKIMTVVSAGPDLNFGTPDDVFGYPLARLGARGD